MLPELSTDERQKTGGLPPDSGQRPKQLSPKSDSMPVKSGSVASYPLERFQKVCRMLAEPNVVRRI